MADDSTQSQLPTPDPALKRLDRLVGTKTYPSTVFSNLSPTPLPYRWEVGDDTLTISVSYGPLDATFEGKFGEDGESFGGGWRPNPGADETVNVPYDIAGRRVE